MTTAFHVSLNVSDLERSIDFYSRLFDAAPVKVREDYAKFELADPPLVLALVPGEASPAGRGTLGHFGMRVSGDLLEVSRTRLRDARVAMRDEGFTTCCYADQRKFWVEDPDGTEWELYEFLGDAAQRDGPPSTCCP